MLVSERQFSSGNDENCERLDDLRREALHEIRQPLSALFALAECVRLTPGLPEVAQQYLARLVEQAGEISGAAASALDRSGAGSADVVRMDEVLESVLESFALTWPGRLVRCGSDGSDSVPGRRAVVRRCLVNLIDNATRAAGPEGNVVVTVERGAGRLHVQVEDDGPGFGRIPRGAGLGIELTRRALTPLGGNLALGVSGGLLGACVVLSLPVVSAPPPPRKVSFLPKVPSDVAAAAEAAESVPVG